MTRIATFVLAGLAVAIVGGGVAAAQSNQFQGPAARQLEIAGTAENNEQNAAIDQGMAEAADKADAAMDGASSEMITGTIAGGGYREERRPRQPLRQERIYGTQAPPFAEGPPSPDAARAVEHSNLGSRSPCDPSATQDPHQAAVNAALCTLERLREVGSLQ